MRERSNSSRQLASSEVPISLLNDRILVRPAIGIKAGLTVIFSKVKTRCTIIGQFYLISTVHIYVSLFRNRKWIKRPTSA